MLGTQTHFAQNIIGYQYKYMISQDHQFENSEETVDPEDHGINYCERLPEEQLNAVEALETLF